MTDTQSENVDLNNIPTKYLNDFVAASQSHDPEFVANLNKTEQAFYLAEVFGNKLDADHPGEHNGSVKANVFNEWAIQIADYVSRNGADALHNPRVVDEYTGDGDSDENEDEN